jgi:hypothetical protein
MTNDTKKNSGTNGDDMTENGSLVPEAVRGYASVGHRRAPASAKEQERQKAKQDEFVLGM